MGSVDSRFPFPSTVKVWREWESGSDEGELDESGLEGHAAAGVQLVEVAVKLLRKHVISRPNPCPHHAYMFH